MQELGGRRCLLLCLALLTLAPHLVGVRLLLRPAIVLKLANH